MKNKLITIPEKPPLIRHFAKRGLVSLLNVGKMRAATFLKKLFETVTTVAVVELIESSRERESSDLGFIRFCFIGVIVI